MSQQRLDSIEEIFNVIDSGDESYAIELIKEIDPDVILKKHKDGRTLLHKAVDALRPAIIEAVIEKNRQSLFTYNSDGLSPLSCAIKQYTKARSMASKTVANQIYFKLCKGRERNNLVNDRANIFDKWEIFHDRVWQHGFELCFKRNLEGKIVSIDMDWLDFALKVIEDGLYVDVGLLGGVNVTRELLMYTVRSNYPEAYDMFSSAVWGQHKGLANRTVTQLTTNPSLANSKEVQQRLNIVLPRLETIYQYPTLKQSAPSTEVLMSYNQELYYKDGDDITKIDKSVFDSEQDESYERLLKLFASSINRGATVAEARDIWSIKPLRKTVCAKASDSQSICLRTISNSSSNFSGNFFANSANVDIEKSKNSVGPNHAK